MGGDVPMLDGTPPEDDDSVEDEDQVDSLAEAIDSTNEAFFPIKAPARPLSWTDPSPLDEHGDVYASSLEGLWLGTYGGHGLEFVNLSTGFVEMPAEDEDGAAGEEGYDSSDSEGMDRRVQYRRVITATKVTGDPNVPSGQVRQLGLLSTLRSGLTLAPLPDLLGRHPPPLGAPLPPPHHNSPLHLPHNLPGNLGARPALNSVPVPQQRRRPGLVRRDRPRVRAHRPDGVREPELDGRAGTVLEARGARVARGPGRRGGGREGGAHGRVDRGDSPPMGRPPEGGRL